VSQTLSVIVPCYNEEESVLLFYDEICKIALNIKTKFDVEFELLFINDGSKDKTLSVLRELSKKDKRVRYISFSRNFGKEAGMYAGLQNSTGDYIAIMDADLQDPPYLLEDMLSGIKNENYDCVAARRVNRKGEPPIRSFFARMFYKVMKGISQVDLVDGARDYRLMTRQVKDAILSLHEYGRFSKGIFGWVGFETKWLEYENVERVAGETKWSFWSLLKYSIEGIVAFSTFPLSLASWLGIIVCLIAFIFIFVVIIRTLVWGDIAGYPSEMCVRLLLGGIQLFCIGVLGKYLSKTYLETKHRPLYIVKETDENNPNKL